MRAVRSPEVGAENAPPVSASSGCGSADLLAFVLIAGATGASGLEDLNMVSSTERSVKKWVEASLCGTKVGEYQVTDEALEKRAASIFADLLRPPTKRFARYRIGVKDNRFHGTCAEHLDRNFHRRCRLIRQPENKKPRSAELARVGGGQKCSCRRVSQMRDESSHCGESK